ncbi:hypothetical protein U9M48_040718 [Paspalum notatum var. saurae]|uniref:Uncharacterized protein n=1 Tax=Paspalum notatum var. saurae TaxID=547442 RepID=A0AAQ3XEI7_PASNO
MAAIAGAKSGFEWEDLSRAVAGARSSVEGAWMGLDRSRAMAGADRDPKAPRRSPRLKKAMMIKEAGGASEEFQILMLKRQIDAIIARNKAAWKDPAAPLEPALPEPVGSGKRRKVVKTEVKQEFIDHMILNPHRPLDGYPEENLAKRGQECRNFYFRQKELADTVLEYQQALIKQYRAKGFAVDYTEVTDDEDN